MLEHAQAALAGEEAWVVGGAVRDELLERPLADLDIACRDPEAAARRYGGPAFPLSERHGAWRVALDGGRTVDFTPLDGSTRVDSIWGWEPKGLLRAAAPLLDLMFKRAIEKDVDGLRRMMEAGDL